MQEKPTIAVIMRFVITPKDPTTAHVNQDMKGMEIIAKVTITKTRRRPKALTRDVLV